MESKRGINGVIRHRSAKNIAEQQAYEDDEDFVFEDSKPTSNAGAKGERTPEKATAGAKGGDRLNRSEEKARIGEIQQDIEADDEFESLKLTPTLVVPKVAASKFARNFVRGFKM